jgi:hypothetical protein
VPKPLWRSVVVERHAHDPVLWLTIKPPLSVQRWTVLTFGAMLN